MAGLLTKMRLGTVPDHKAAAPFYGKKINEIFILVITRDEGQTNDRINRWKAEID